MAYLIKVGLGLALYFGGLIIFNVQLQELLDIGTCASGNVQFEIRPGYECPEGIETKFFLIFASIIGGLIGCAIFAFRGDPPWGERRSAFSLFGWGTLAWGLFFAGTGAALLIGAPYGESVDPATGEVVGRPDSQLGATITGITFLVMGLPALLLGLWSVFRGLTGRRDERPAAIPAGDSKSTGRTAGSTARKASGDSIGKLERLQKLREDGALSDAEFQREKAKIIAGQ